MNLADLQQHPKPLAQHYQHFNVANRLLFTGHSHQAWPDCGLRGQNQAWKDAAEFVDDKWDKAEQKAQQVRNGFSRLLDDSTGDYALGQNTFDLVLRFLSALPLGKRPRIVTSDGEFHSLRRLLTRLGEEGVEIVTVASLPLDSFIDRLVEAVNNTTAAVCCSKVFFQNGLIVDNLSPVAERCLSMGSELLVDAYHCINVVPFSVQSEGLDQAYIVGGGYKYCQLGEGNCFIRLPQHCQLRPIATGWYSEFDLLANAQQKTTFYGEGPARFAGATYDPTSHYRAAEVFEFFRQQQLTPTLLREISQQQIHDLQSTFLDLDFDPAIISLDVSIPLTLRGGFITFQSPHAAALQQYLKQSGVHCDNRDENLRFGPAPYLSTQQCTRAMKALRVAINALPL